jgi:hypothetical protein
VSRHYRSFTLPPAPSSHAWREVFLLLSRLREREAHGAVQTFRLLNTHALARAGEELEERAALLREYLLSKTKVLG